MPAQRNVLFLQGGWDGHQPATFVDLLSQQLARHGFRATVDTTLDRLDDPQALRAFHLIVPQWTMGSLSPAQSENLSAAIATGIGLGGIHGGMADAFRGDLTYEWMVGGHFVGHPYVGKYTVTIQDQAHPITEGLPDCFAYNSEQYYMLTDPAIHVLADAHYAHDRHDTTMPVAWTKHWGQGRVFYSALGHDPAEFTRYPAALQLTLQGLLWAARA